MKKSLLIKGALTGGLQSVVQILLVFSAIPVFIKLLGSESYGIFGLVSAIGNLNIFTNLGLSASVVKHVSEQGQCRESDYDIIVSVIILFIVLFTVCAVVILFNKILLLSVMNIPAEKYLASRWLFISVVCGNALLVLGQLLKAVLDSCGKVYLTNYLQILYGMLYWGLIILVLLLGYDLAGVGIAILSAGLIWFTLLFFNALSTWGVPKFEGLKSNLIRISKKQLKYGGKVFTGGLVSFFYEPLLRLFISNFIGVCEVGYFDIGIRIKNQLWGVVSRILYPLFPFIAQSHGEKKIGFIIQEIEQKILFIATPFIVLFCFTIHPFIKIWIGENTLIISRTAAVVVSAFFLLSCSVIPFYYYLLSKDHPEKTIILQGYNALTSSLLFLIFFEWAGYYAALMGSAGGILSSFAVSLYYHNKYLNITLISHIELLKLVIILIVNILAGFLIHMLLIENFLKLMTIPVAIFCITLFLYNRLCFFSEEDINRYLGNHNVFSELSKKILCRHRG